MPTKRPLSPLIFALAAAAAAPGASAIGWQRPSQSAVLGQALDFGVSLRLDPGDTVDPACIKADVLVGDNPLPGPVVRVHVDTSRADTVGIRVQTAAAVDEPVVTVAVSVGCPPRMSRRFVLLADPPAPAPVLALAPASPAPGTRAEAAPAPAPSTRAAAPAPAAPRPAPPPLPPRPPQAEVRAAAPVMPEPVPRKPARKASAPAPAASAAPVARLRLDAAEPPPKATTATAAPAIAEAASAVEAAIQAVEQAASATQAARSAASAAEDRIAALERTVAQLRSDSNASRESMAQMRAQVVKAEQAARWVTPLALAVGALLLMAGWLWWRVRELNELRARAWKAAAASAVAAEPPPAATVQLPVVNTEIPVPAAPPVALQPPPEPPAPEREAQLDLAVMKTDVLPVGSIADRGPPRDVTIEELLDLEQQAEFFIVLGQDDAAIDLLVHHLRDTGGGSPLPYLKLLEIYRRRGERDAYERTRTRFNHRFNAYAPDWDADLQAGRSLDSYPGVVPRLQQVWPRPLDAMAELEALLFRKSRGDLFELPAYREVLFLYSLARDLLDREAGDSGNVDLLLPLGDGGEFSATSPHPYFALERDSVFDGNVTRPGGVPVDLDLSVGGEPTSVLDPLTPRRL